MSYLKRVRRFSAGVAAMAGMVLVAEGGWAQTAEEPTQLAAVGAALFTEKGCTECHGSAEQGPDLGVPAAERSFDDLAAAMWNHLPTMVNRAGENQRGLPTLTAESVNALVAYLGTLSYFDQPGDPNAGRRVFFTKRCEHCHKVRGAGGDAGPDLDFVGIGSPLHIAAGLWNHAEGMSRAMEESGQDRITLSGDELNDVIAYIRFSSVRGAGSRYLLPGSAAAGADVFEASCTVCHGGAGPGPDLTRRMAGSSRIDFAASMWNKLPAMVAAARGLGVELPQLRASQMADLLAYLYGSGYVPQQGDADAGRALLVEKRCLTCHALDGEGGARAADLAEGSASSRLELVAALWNHVGMEEAVSGGPVAWPVLRPEEIAHVSAFLAGR